MLTVRWVLEEEVGRVFWSWPGLEEECCLDLLPMMATYSSPLPTTTMGTLEPTSSSSSSSWSASGRGVTRGRDPS